ncbi:hypothetical protein [Amycolatopsis sp. DSM 110486]|uniref:hypothetical protein n=1 Tax=Amycolatopsis sp. DSM 110486 TaxID=2865832 RepID=UPI001C6A0680|nr:hypothetical protein [Amycolatopsis sp. DSM 110486]QYN17600.1 hypothetical protein K1T34_32975 [Amycolatopsis sp. DSM 110486]
MGCNCGGRKKAAPATTAGAAAASTGASDDPYFEVKRGGVVRYRSKSQTDADTKARLMKAELWNGGRVVSSYA